MLFILHWGEAAACKLAMSGTIPQKCLNKIKLFYDVVREGLCHVFVRDFFFPMVRIFSCLIQLTAATTPARNS